MQVLPSDVVAYNRTPEFTEGTVPAALRASHSTKQGVWGRIVVLEGELVYRIYGPPAEEHLLRPGAEGVVAPQDPHEVEPRGTVRFYVEFLR